MTIRTNVYLDYGRTFFPDNIDVLVGLSGQRKVFRWAYKAPHLGPNVYSLGTCREFVRDDCKASLAKAFAKHNQTVNIIPSVEGIR